MDLQKIKKRENLDGKSGLKDQVHVVLWMVLSLEVVDFFSEISSGWF